jgi:hypothetical protein
MKFTGGQPVSVHGWEFPNDTVNVSSGWNIIGSLSAPVDVASITSVPGGIMTTPFFGYGGGYFTADSIQPGMGYWVKVNDPGSLILSASPAATPGAGRIRIVSTTEHPPAPPGNAELTERIPERFILNQNYPNPFNPSTEITYSVPTQAFVTIRIFDVLGRDVATLVNAVRAPGEYQASWNADGVPSGIYLCRMDAGGLTQVGRMLLVR